MEQDNVGSVRSLTGDFTRTRGKDVVESLLRAEGGAPAKRGTLMDEAGTFREARGISTAFFAVLPFEDVNLSPRRGEVHALPGRNRAGQDSVPIARPVLAGLSGVVRTLHPSAGHPLAMVGAELDAIAAVAIGGALLTGGSGRVAGTPSGVPIRGPVQNCIVLDGALSSRRAGITMEVLLFAFIALQNVVLEASGAGVAPGRRREA